MPGPSTRGERAVYSLIVPVFRNALSLPALVAALAELDARLGHQLEVVVVVDGSPDECAAILADLLPHQPHPTRLILLSRNFGSFAAIRTGLRRATGPYFAVLAADLQEPPELVLQFFQTLERGDVDVVVGSRLSRADPLLRRLTSRIFWALYRRLVVPQIPANGVDVFGCNLAFRDCLIAFEESNTSLIALLYWLGFRREEVEYVRRRREHGRSAWSLRRRIDYLMDSVFAFTDLPIKLLLGVGVVGVAVAMVFGAVVLAARVSGLVVLPGYAATILVVLFFGGINTFGLGLVGAYTWRGYENSKRRPLAVTMREIEFARASDDVG